MLVLSFLNANSPEVGFLARIWASRFASGALVKLTAELEAPWRKTPTLKKPRDRPTPGGSAEGTGGMSSHSARPATRSPTLGGSAEGTGGVSPHPAKPTLQRPSRILQNRRKEQNIQNSGVSPLHGACGQATDEELLEREEEEHNWQ